MLWLNRCLFTVWGQELGTFPSLWQKFNKVKLRLQHCLNNTVTVISTHFPKTGSIQNFTCNSILSWLCHPFNFFDLCSGNVLLTKNCNLPFSWSVLGKNKKPSLAQKLGAQSSTGLSWYFIANSCCFLRLKIDICWAMKLREFKNLSLTGVTSVSVISFFVSWY